ncbi:MAG: hypothetical protein WAU08_08635, partial [Flavobacteriales bacterium]
MKSLNANASRQRTAYWHKATALATLISNGFSAHAQVTIPAHNSNDGSVNDPFGSYYGYERTAMIYTPAEIGGTGTITHVGFYVNSLSSPGNAKQVRIYMKERTNLFTANTTYATETTGATLVYGPTNNQPASFTANSWKTVALVTPFAYSGGANNLEVIVETNFGGSGSEGSTGKQFRFSTQTNNRYYQNWFADTDPPAGNGTRSTDRPNIQLTGIALAPCAAQPTSLALTSVTTISAEFSWTAPSPAPGSGYQWEVRTGGLPGTGGTSASGSTLSGVTTANTGTTLTASTSYNFYVRANCGSNVFSSWSGPLNFTTPAPPPVCPGSLGATSVTIASLPYQTTGQSTCGSGNNVTSTNVVAVCGSANYYLAEDRTYIFTATVNGVYNILLTTTGDYDAGITLYHGCPFTPGSTCEGNAQSTTGLTRILTPTLTAGETYYLVVDNWTSPACIAGYNLAIDPPATCFPPTAVNVSNATTTSAEVGWTCASCMGDYIVEYGAAGFTPGNGATAGAGGTIWTGAAVSNSPVTITGLSASTGYSVFVREHCSGVDYSANSSVANFATLCGTVNVPFTLDFESAVVPAFPTCVGTQTLNGSNAWSVVSAPNVNFPSKTAQYSYNTSFDADAWFFTPGINLSTGTTYKLTYRYGTEGFDERLEVKNGTTATAAGMTNLIYDHGTFQTVSGGSSTQTVTFTVGTSGVYYLGWHAFSLLDEYLLFVDDINLSLAPALDLGATALAAPAIGCYSAAQIISVTVKNLGSQPINFAATSMTVTTNVTGVVTANLSGTVTSGTLAVGATLDVPMSLPLDMSAAGTYTFNASTAVTGDGDPANNAMVATTRTATATVAVPYSQDFSAGASIPSG